MKKLLLIFAFLPYFATGQYISTICGNGVEAYTGDGGPASVAELINPRSVAIDKNGNIYITCIGATSVIRKINTSGIISTIAGSNTPGYGGDGGPATAAMLNSPRQVAFDRLGNIYIADEINNRIRKIDGAGTITTFAGTGTGASSGDGGPATAADIFFPSGIIFDSSGNAYIAENSASRVRKVNTAGIISTYAGIGTSGYTGDGGPATAAKVGEINRLLVVGTDLYLSDGIYNCIRKVNAAGIISTFAGDGSGASGYFGDNGPATAAEFSNPSGMSADNSGNIYISDRYNFVTRVINSSGIIKTCAGNGIAGYNGDCIIDTLAELDTAFSVACDPAGALYIADQANYRIRKITSVACISAVNKVSNLGESVNIYPNPATDILNITSKGKINKVVINDMLGLTVFNQAYNYENVTVDVSGISPGVYLVQVNGSEMRKFVKE